MDILGLSQIRWLYQGEHFTQYASCFIYSGNKQTRRYVAGFLITPKARRSLLEAQPLSERIIKARFKTKFRSVTLFQCYAATEPDDDATKDKFYDRLATSVNKTPKGDLILILGDFNAKLGSNNGAESSMHSVQQEMGMEKGL